MLARVYSDWRTVSAPRFQMNMRPSSTGWSVSTPITPRSRSTPVAHSRSHTPCSISGSAAPPMADSAIHSRSASTRFAVHHLVLSSKTALTRQPGARGSEDIGLAARRAKPRGEGRWRKKRAKKEASGALDRDPTLCIPSEGMRA
jgi:hypothetical protein